MLFRSSAIKSTEQTPLGLQLWAAPSGDILIVRVDDHGLFAGRGLKAGLRLDHINAMNCSGKTVAEVQIYFLHQPQGRVTLHASAPGQPRAAALQKNLSMDFAPPPPSLVEVSDESEMDEWSQSSFSSREEEEDVIEALHHAFAF